MVGVAGVTGLGRAPTRVAWAWAERVEEVDRGLMGSLLIGSCAVFPCPVVVFDLHADGWLVWLVWLVWLNWFGWYSWFSWLSWLNFPWSTIPWRMRSLFVGYESLRALSDCCQLTGTHLLGGVEVF